MVVGGRDEAPRGAIRVVGPVHDPLHRVRMVAGPVHDPLRWVRRVVGPVHDPLHRERKVVGPVHDLSHWIATMWDWRASHALGDADCVASGESRRDFT